MAPMIIMFVNFMLMMGTVLLRAPETLPSWSKTGLVILVAAVVYGIWIPVAVFIGRRTHWRDGGYWVGMFLVLIITSFGISFRSIGYVNAAWDTSPPETRRALFVRHFVHTGKSGGSHFDVAGLKPGDPISLDGMIQPRSIGLDERNVPIAVTVRAGALSLPWIVRIERIGPAPE